MLTTLRVILLSSLFLPAISFAENMLIDVNVLFSVPDAGGTDDFHTGKTLFVNYNYYSKPWLVATGGVFITEKISTNPQSDVVGTHQETIESKGITFGMRSEYEFSKRNKIYGRFGLLLYSSKLTVEDYFNPGLPVTKVSDSTDGYGYYVGMAWAHSFNRKISLQLELLTMAQLDLFKDKSKFPFDLKNTGINIGVGYAF
jgi:hypothetical protein